MKNVLLTIYSIYKIIFTLPLILGLGIYATFIFAFATKKEGGYLYKVLHIKAKMEKFFLEKGDYITHGLYIFWILVFMYFTFK